ncbi:MAG: exosortase/archaeosortase family protein [Pseudomonadales bacterium]|nr:exosortase/archaeosortase family protein [Pseudomonadales bacterium]
MNTASSPRINTPALNILFMFTFTIAIHAPAAIGLVESWWGAGARYGHGYLSLALCFYLIYKMPGEWLPPSRYQRLAALSTSILLSSLCWASILLDITTIQLIALPLILISNTYIFCQWKYATSISLVWGLLMFTVPIWNPINPILQDLTVIVSTFVVGLLNIPMHVDGNYISIPAGTFKVAAGCSGFKYFISSISLCYLLAILSAGKVSYRIGIVLLGVLFALIANWIRVSAIILIGHIDSLDNEIVRDHDNFGWVIYGSMLILFFKLFSPTITIPSLPQQTTHSPGVRPRAPSIAILIIMAAPALASFSLVKVRATSPVLPDGYDYSQEQTAGYWYPNVDATFDWSPNFPSTTSTIDAHYHHKYNNSAVLLSIRPHEINGFNRSFLDYLTGIETDDWTKLTEAGSRIGSKKSQDAILANSSKQTGNYLLVRYVYVIGEKTSTSILDTKLNRLYAIFTGQTQATYISIATECQNKDCESEKLTLDEFQSDMNLEEYINSLFKR